MHISASNSASFMILSARSLCCIGRSRNFIATFFPKISKRSSCTFGHVKCSFTDNRTLFVKSACCDETCELLFGGLDWSGIVVTGVISDEFSSLVEIWHPSSCCVFPSGTDSPDATSVVLKQ